MLVTAVSPTPAGEGKTTTTVGLGDALTRIGERAMICLREPALGPVFGMKGGAAGGGYAQVVPMEDINLHFTGDFAAIGVATNLLAALIDNHIHHGNALGIDVRRITWRRVLDVNDRALRDVVVGLGGPGNGYPRESGFDIVVASEVMAIFCLATEPRRPQASGWARSSSATRATARPVRARDLEAHGAMTAILRDALAPNLVQTLEHTPAFVHGGPFANIAHGCNSVVATRVRAAARRLRRHRGGVRRRPRRGEVRRHPVPRDRACGPSAAVIVATVRAMKYHGGVEVADLPTENVAALERGIGQPRPAPRRPCARRWGLPAVVAINHRAEDTDAEIAALVAASSAAGATRRRRAATSPRAARARRSSRARSCGSCDEPSELRFTYPDDATLWQKMKRDRDAHLRRIRHHRHRPPCARRSSACRTRATAATRCASRRPSTRSRPTRSCAARRPGTSSTSARCASRRAPGSS